jgi:PAS domain S-box-containing protein
MRESLQAILGADWFPHVYVLRSRPDAPWISALTNLSIAAAHFGIVLVLWQVMRKRKESQFRWIALLFGMFNGIRCLTQALGIWPFWHPFYELHWGFRAVTAVLAVSTAVALARSLPALHRLPSATDLEKEIKERRGAEEAALEKEERLRNFVESVQDYAMYMIDLHGVIRSWNSGAERMTGYTAGEAIGHNCSRFLSPEDVSAGKAEESLQIVKETGRFEGENRLLRKDGTLFLAHVIMRPLLGPSGKLRGFSKVTRDITESRELETRFQVLLEAAPDAFLIVNRAGAIEFINAQGEKTFGYAREEVLGKSVDMFNPERVREMQAVYRDQLFSGSGRAEGGSETDLWGLRKDGAEFPLEFTLSPLDTRDGRVFLFAIRDITERKKAETRFRALLESAPDAMVIVNREGCIELANLQTEKLFGYSRLELVGKSVDTMVPHSRQESHANHRAEFFNNPKKREMGANLDLRARRKDGTEFPVEISLSPLQGPHGISVTAAIRDVTERKQAAQLLAEKMSELHQSNEALEQFAHIASHDLQEPLRMVASYTQLLSRRYKGRLDADADEFIGFAVDGTQRMKRLIEDLLLYSRTGKGAPPVVEFDANGSLREAVNNLHAAIEESHAEITSGPLPTLTAVESQLVQLLQNLIGNAIKYRGDRIPKVHVSAGEGCREWIFSVADNGIGIDPKYFDRIFQIFQRLHGRGEYEGTGIGLAICKRILQQQGGRIWVESEPGKGSVFHFSLPMR